MSVLRGEAALRVFARQRYNRRHDAIRATAAAEERRLGDARLNPITARKAPLTPAALRASIDHNQQRIACLT